MRVLICGARDWTNEDVIQKKIQDLQQEDLTIIAGGCKGVDTIAEQSARNLGIPVIVFPAEWDKFGRAAGPIRNKQMLTEGKPNLVIAFHPDLENSKGTKDMVFQARKNGIPVEIISDDECSHGIAPPIEILLFYDTTGPLGPLTNFYKLKNGLNIGGEHFLTTEQYYQVIKFRGRGATPRMLEYSNLIKLADSPMKAKMLGHQTKNLRFGAKWKLNKSLDDRLVNDLIDEYSDIKYRENWNRIGILVMVNAVYHKFTQYPELHKLMTDLPDQAYLVEHTTRDKVWADGGDGGTGRVGQNRLGKILTALSFCLKHGACDKMSGQLKNMIRINVD
jgi:predicted NAD-dependent protein-ADP-ribosyltransferase YbiA (DUF1768 family)